MTKENKENKVNKEEQKPITLQDATVEQLKVIAFDTEQEIKVLQRNLQQIFNELQARLEKK